ncbi:ABC transporter substrate-binding protein [Brachybacterium sacelli]|uniref:Peptide/nickel transport system substrate-binding protein n=1 Tax=Brachybacterium sacelli TaxID=173364 RepID=A0ABS4WYN3_9MICO|nr:ABC transporter substrate-binding protein [Brachybacterium sacelli]MBP2381319.1 peptide/nickel transport system substrate-binding protein [Brachybacterium sacelli]
MTPPHIPTRREALRLGVYGSALGAVGLTAGCGSEADATGARALRIAQKSEPTGLDPHLESGLDGMNVLINIFDMLTERDAEGELVPRLASGWEAIDEHRWRFRLREDVVFHNGEVFDARSVKFSIERLIDPETASTIVELRAVDHVEIIDDHTVDLVMADPDPVIPEKVSLFGGAMLPPRHFAEVGAERFAAQPVGTGPFRFVSWRKAQLLRLEANEEHWNGRPAFDELHFTAMPNPASALAGIQSDVIDMVSALDPEAALQLEGYKDVELAKYPGIRMYFVVLDTQHEILRDVRVRRALNHAVDVPLLIEAVLNDSGREAATIVPQEAFGHDPDVPAFARDPGEARQLLAEAGHADGFTLRFTSSNEDQLVCEALAGMLGEIGVQLDLELLEPGTFAERLSAEDPSSLGSMYLTGSTGWTLDGGATLQSYVRSDRKRSRIRSERADAMMDTIEQSIDPDVRLEALHEMQQWLHEEAPFLFLYQADLDFATNGEIQWEPNVNGTLAMETAR